MDLNVGHLDDFSRSTKAFAAVHGTRKKSRPGRVGAVRQGRLGTNTNLLLTVSEVADLLGVHRSTLYRTIERARLPLPIVRVGATMRVPRAAVERMLRGELPTGEPESRVELSPRNDRAEPASYCFACGSPIPASSRPMCSAARRSSSPTGAV